MTCALRTLVATALLAAVQLIPPLQDAASAQDPAAPRPDAPQGESRSSSAAPSDITLTEDYADLMMIPSVVAVESTPLHTYILSEVDGLAVFRNTADSLQWLYTSSGMQRRGYRMRADARFAYLYGSGNRLSVVEPTSVLGVYSSTDLPAAPLAAARTGSRLWVAMGERGLGALSLESPEAVDTDPLRPYTEAFEGQSVVDLASDPSSHLFVLSRDRATGERSLHVVESEQIGESRYARRVVLDREVERLHLAGGQLFASDRAGDLWRVQEDGTTDFLAGFGSQPDKIRIHGDVLFVRTLNGKLWAGDQWRGFTVVRGESEAGNYIGVSHHGLYLSQFDRVTRVRLTDGSPAASDQPAETPSGGAVGERPQVTGSGQPRLVPIADQILPFPKPLIVPIALQEPMGRGQVDFAIVNGPDNAVVRGRSIFWQPGSSQNGRHHITLLATSDIGLTDTTSFLVDVRAFNSPPRFAPIRPMSIPMQESFTTRFEATDPDGMDTGLIRYLGVDLPDGSRIDEKTGQFNWSPTIRQVGQHAFQVIATDQFGAAASLEVSIRVVDLQDPYGSAPPRP